MASSPAEKALQGKVLIVLDLQNDFVSPNGKLPVLTGFVDKLEGLISAFRKFGVIIWVRSEFEANRLGRGGDTIITGLTKPTKDDNMEDDAELFLARTGTREPCCIRDSVGADYPNRLKRLVDRNKDIEVIKTSYSAFGYTTLLLRLRSLSITELFVCGCNSNSSAFATVKEAICFGISVTLVEDCLGYRHQMEHEEAMRQMGKSRWVCVLRSKDLRNHSARL